MQAYIVGADHLGHIPKLLALYGITIGEHITGRNPSHQRKPSGLKEMDIMILFTDFLGHNVMKNYRAAAAANRMHIVTCRRSQTALQQSLQNCPALSQTALAAHA
jgi:hypothetical protein